MGLHPFLDSNFLCQRARGWFGLWGQMGDFPHMGEIPHL
jgi:hypothetical protein